MCSVGEELAELQKVAGSPCQSRWDEFQDNQVLHKVNVKKTTLSPNGLVHELRRRVGCRRFLLMDVIGKITELVLSPPEMVVNTLAATPSVAV